MASILHLCRLVGHKRSKRRALLTGGTWRSECIYCHTPLLRISPNNWKPLPVNVEQHRHL